MTAANGNLLTFRTTVLYNPLIFKNYLFMKTQTYVLTDQEGNILSQMDLTEMGAEWKNAELGNSGSRLRWELKA